MTSNTAPHPLRRRAAAAVAVLLLAAAALLILGVLLEHRAGIEYPPGALTSEQREAHHDESTEGGHHDESTDGAPVPTGAPASNGGETAERLIGISTESPWVVALGTVVSVALAAAVWQRPNRAVIIVVMAFTAAALVLDIVEITHQLGDGGTGLAVLAGVIAALRVTTLVGGAYLFRSQPRAR